MTVNFSRNRLIGVGAFAIILLSGLALGTYLSTRSPGKEQTDVAAEEGNSAAGFSFPTLSETNSANNPGLPLGRTGNDKQVADLNGDGAVDQTDASLFMQKYLAADMQADLDQSGQINALDLAKFRELCGPACN